MCHITKHKEECFTIEHFLTEEECKAIISYTEWLASNNILEWNQISFYDSFAMGFWEEDPTGGCELFGLPKNYFHGVLKQKIKDACENALGKDLAEVSYHAQKWKDGAYASFHSDNSDEHGNPSEFERSKYAAFIYLNEDFKGGNLNFKHHDVNIKPKAGMLAVFAGGYTNEHEVTKVHGGTRYTVGSFWDNADAVYTEEQIKEREERLKKTRAEQDLTYQQWAKQKELGITQDYVGKYGEV
jgi:Rps23 Pro-64 3,4-dihydroxylase Tpa1-like proline 4-hydroxylase